MLLEAMHGVVDVAGMWVEEAHIRWEFSASLQSPGGSPLTLSLSPSLEHISCLQDQLNC